MSQGETPRALAALGLPLDHIGIAVWKLDKAAAPYQLLGLTPEGEDEEIVSQGVRVRALRCGESLLELLAPTTPDSPIRTFLDKRGSGMHHLALRAADLEREIVRLSAQGARFISTTPRPGRHGTRVVFLHPSWTGGVLVELVEHL